LSSEAESITFTGGPADRLLREHASAVGQRVVSQPRKLGWRHRLVMALTITDAGAIAISSSAS